MHIYEYSLCKCASYYFQTTNFSQIRQPLTDKTHLHISFKTYCNEITSCVLLCWTSRHIDKMKMIMYCDLHKFTDITKCSEIAPFSHIQYKTSIKWTHSFF